MPCRVIESDIEKRTLTSLAQAPLVARRGIFCRLVTSRDTDGTPKVIDMEAARAAACAEINEDLSILPQLLQQKSVTKDQIDDFHNMTRQMKAWAKACTEPMSLGAGHSFARQHWVSWHVRVTGSDSLSPQTFLYLYERRRL